LNPLRQFVEVFPHGGQQRSPLIGWDAVRHVGHDLPDAQDPSIDRV
jgi:hypothetical protein